MPPSEIRKDARKSLTGKWRKAVCIILAYLLISFVIGVIEGLAKEGSTLALILELASFIISVPMTFGLIISFIKLKRGEDVNAFGFLNDGFSRFGKSWGIWAHTLLKLLLPIICLIFVIFLMAVLIVVNSVGNFADYFAYGYASGEAGLSTGLIVLFVVLYLATLIYVVSRSFLYVLAYYIGYDEPDLSSKECVKKSEDLMKGNRGNYFLLQLSFIGWAILAVLTLGIGMLWLMPYISVAEVCFYERISNIEARKVDGEVNIEE